MIWALVITAAYFLGSIPFGLLAGKRRGVDVRTVGSGNIGATNVARNLGKKTGAVVLLLDALKGAVPVLALRIAAAAGAEVPTWALASVGFAAIVGHCFSIWLRFGGGKGVATALGVFLAIDPLVAIIGVSIFGALYAAFRVVSIGSVIAAASFPLLLWILERPAELVWLGLAGAGVVIGKHHGNIRRLIARSENKL